MKSYCSITEVKSALEITATTDDDVILKISEAATKAIDNYTNRSFQAETATKYFDGHIPLWVDDLLDITTIKTDEDGDGTFENTLTVTTDYLLYPLNKYPKTKIELSVSPTYGGFGVSKKGCEIAGLWGYGDGISRTPYISATTLSAAIVSTTAATFTVTSVANLSAGHTILIDSEQMYIYSIATLTLTVERGVNGTTAATHLINAPVYVYQYPADIKLFCIDLAVESYQNRSKRGIKSEKIGDYSYTLDTESVEQWAEKRIFDYRKLNI